MFDPEVYAARRRRLLEDLPAGALALFLGNDESPMNYAGNVYPFRQDGSFLYYFGLDAPGLTAALDADEGTATLYGHDPSLDEIVWTGAQPSLQEKAERAGVEHTGTLDDLADALRAAAQNGQDVHYLPPYRARHTLKLAEWLGRAPEEIGEGASEALIGAVVAQRSVKSEDEVAEIEKAVGIAHAMHTLAMRRTKPGVMEEEMAGALEGVALARGSRVSFPIIFSVRGEILHDHARAYAMQEGELALCDAGATAPETHYAADVTRVTPVSGRFSEQQKAVYEAVLDAQEAAIAAVEPGIAFKTIHLLAARRLTEALNALGLMRGDVDEAVAAGAHALFFPHGLGHMMGLDVHDMEGLGEDRVGYDEETRRSEQFGLSALRLGRRLEEGFVVTVEPGCYFIPALIDAWRAEKRHADFINYDEVERYKSFGGIRIEDDVLVTEEGARVLGPAIPKTVADVEAMAARS